MEDSDTEKDDTNEIEEQDNPQEFSEEEDFPVPSV